MFFLPFTTLSLRVVLMSLLLSGLVACGGGSRHSPPAEGVSVSSLSANSVRVTASSATSLSSSTSSSQAASNSFSSAATASSLAHSLSSSSSFFDGPEPLPAPCEQAQYRFDGHNCTYSPLPMPVYIPAADEVVIYLNSKEKDFAGYSIFLWSGCGDGWADSQTDGYSIFTAPYEWFQRLGVVANIWTGVQEDSLYGAYFVLKIKPDSTCGDFIIRSSGLADQTIDLKVDITHTGSALERMLFVIESPEGLRKSLSSSLPVCVHESHYACKSWQELFPPGSSSSSAALTSQAPISQWVLFFLSQ